MSLENNYMVIIKGNSKYYENLDNTSEKGKKGTKKKDVIKLENDVLYHSFAKAGDYARDKLWIDIFKDASYNKFPEHFSFNGESISHTSPDGTKVFFTLTLKDPYELYVDFKKFLEKYGNIHSEDDCDYNRTQ